MLFNSLSFIVGGIYIIIGIFVINTKSFAIKLEPITAYILGCLLIIYGIFRIVRVILRLKNKNK